MEEKELRRIGYEVAKAISTAELRRFAESCRNTDASDFATDLAFERERMEFQQGVLNRLKVKMEAAEDAIKNCDLNIEKLMGSLADSMSAEYILDYAGDAGIE